MRQTKRHYMGFRTTDEQAAKLSRIADRAGVNTSEILRWLVDGVEDVRPVDWHIVWAGSDTETTAVQR